MIDQLVGANNAENHSMVTKDAGTSSNTKTKTPIVSFSMENTEKCREDKIGLGQRPFLETEKAREASSRASSSNNSKVWDGKLEEVDDASVEEVKEVQYKGCPKTAVSTKRSYDMIKEKRDQSSPAKHKTDPMKEKRDQPSQTKSSPQEQTHQTNINQKCDSIAISGAREKEAMMRKKNEQNNHLKKASGNEDLEVEREMTTKRDPNRFFFETEKEQMKTKQQTSPYNHNHEENMVRHYLGTFSFSRAWA